MKMAVSLFIFFCIAVFLLPSCKKKHGKHADQIEAADPYEQDIEGLRPAKKIDPEGEAENVPHLAVSGLDLAADGSEPDDSLGKSIIQKPTPEPDEGEFTVARIGNHQIVRVFASRFSSMPKRSRILIYHLARAVLAGRDIVFDQMHKDALEVRQLLECILRLGKNSQRQLDQALRDYYLLFGINDGFYHQLTGQKFIPGMSFDDFVKAVHAAHAEGVHMDLQRDESIDGMLSRLRRIIFDADYQKDFFKGRKSGWQGNEVGGGYLNLYKGVRSKALKHFDEKYPQNSRLINIEGNLVEEVYRAGDKRRRIPPGRYSKELRRVISRLQAALAFADHDQRLVLADLIEYFRTGEVSSAESAFSTWQDRVWPVEFFMGFLDKSLDYQQRKGIWTGWVGLSSASESSMLQSLARELNYFEKRMPWAEKFRMHWKKVPTFVAMELLTAAGRLCPICHVSYRIPPDRSMGERFSSKVLFFSNVEQTRLHAVVKPMVKGFLPSAEREEVLANLERIYWATQALVATVGPSIGKISQSVGTWIRSDLVVVARLRAKLVALWLLGDKKLVDLGLLLPEDDYTVGWKVALIQAVVLDSLDPENLLDVDARARRVWIRKMVDAGAVEITQDKDGVFATIADVELFRKTLSEMLIRTERILSSGDEASARAFVRAWEKSTPWLLRDAIAQRAKQLGLGSVMVCLMPKLKPLRGDVPGRFVDAKISFSEGFNAQLLRISRY